eukprot:15355811-Ditylum_brightwellii.AAC.1
MRIKSSPDILMRTKVWFINLKDRQIPAAVLISNFWVTSCIKGLMMAVDLDITPPYQARGPWPLGNQGWRPKWEGMSDQMW